MKDVHSFYGLVNYGNSCYQNAVIQVMAHTTGFEDAYQLDKKSKASLNPILLELASLLRNLQKPILKGDDLSRCTIPSKRFYRATTKSHRFKDGTIRFPPNRQQDAHEFMLFLLNLITDESPPMNGFYVTLQKSFTCRKCKNTLQSQPEVHPILSLALPEPSMRTCSLQNVLKKIETPQTIAKLCERCKGGQALMLEQFNVKGQFIAIHLQRFVNSRSKLVHNGILVRIPLLFKFSGSEETFRLYAMILRKEGTLPSVEQGHYYAIVKGTRTRQWFKMDDESVTCVDVSVLQQVDVRRESYILFYTL